MPTEQEQQQQPTLTERGMAAGLRAMNWLSSSELVERIGLRGPAERLVYNGSKTSFRAATTAGRTFRAASQPRAARAPVPRGRERAVRSHPDSRSSSC